MSRREKDGEDLKWDRYTMVAGVSGWWRQEPFQRYAISTQWRCWLPWWLRFVFSECDDWWDGESRPLLILTMWLSTCLISSRSSALHRNAFASMWAI